MSSNEEVATLNARIKDLETTLGLRNEKLTVTFRLTPSQSKLLGLLLVLPHVTPDMVRQRLEIATDPKVAFHRLRQHLLPWDIFIKSRRNVGYWLEDDMKVRVKTLLVEAGASTDQTTAPPIANVA